jgi:hypothetical protein
MFEKTSRVYIALGAGTVPGVVVDDPTPTVYRNRNGADVATLTVPVISLRTWQGRSWHQLSFESATLLAARETTETDLDVLDDGAPMPLAALFTKHRESLQAHLSRRAAPVAAPVKRAARA